MIKINEKWIYGKRREGRLYLCVIHSKEDLQIAQQYIYENEYKHYPEMVI